MAVYSHSTLSSLFRSDLDCSTWEMSPYCWGENQNLKTNKQTKSKQQSLAGILHLHSLFFVFHLRFENSIYRLWRSFVWLLGLLFWHIGYAETEAHSTADIQISQIINSDEKVSQVQDCELTGFSGLTGLSASCFFAMWSAAQSTPLQCCESVSMNVWGQVICYCCYCPESQPVDLVRQGHLCLW